MGLKNPAGVLSGLPSGGKSGGQLRLGRSGFHSLQGENGGAYLGMLSVEPIHIPAAILQGELEGDGIELSPPSEKSTLAATSDSLGAIRLVSSV